MVVNMYSSDKDSLPPLVVIAGPTATGKSELAVCVAEAIGGEVVSADSMLIYRHMNIGTAKPTREEMSGIPHHMIDVAAPDEEYSVAIYQKQARKCIADIMAKGKIPVLAGGTGLYIRSVIDDYDFTEALRDQNLRDKLFKDADNYGYEFLHNQLAEVDRKAAAKLHPNDIRRIIRALEVYYLTGKPLSSSWRVEKQYAGLYNLVFVGLTMDREELYKRIEIRVDSMIDAGLKKEVHWLLENGYHPNLQSMQGLGYKEIIAYLLGAMSWSDTVELLKRNTRRFAKRQLTWFRRDLRIKWLAMDLSAADQWAVQEIVKDVEGKI